MHSPRVSLVGAGPGDPDLITVKGLKAITSADVILYDALSNPELLKHAPGNCECIYVGKRSGVKYMKQDRINLLIVQKAMEKGHVVRLKGGDPFVFGRGHEELEYVQSFGVPVSIVPGISSSISLPSLQEVPITKRGFSDSFWVLTATKSKNELSQDLHIAAQSSATVVILMGRKKLEQIREIYMNQGKSELPVMIIEKGSCRNEQVVLSTIEDIVRIAESRKIGTPATIVIGKVVTLHPEWVTHLCLAC